ncbi:hypothetical protein TRVL_05964 [Trypanosoma vivax]|nr:hypothetical protein TRVL_05964 [Trypanosoma vivax]
MQKRQVKELNRRTWKEPVLWSQSDKQVHWKDYGKGLGVSVDHNTQKNSKAIFVSNPLLLFCRFPSVSLLATTICQRFQRNVDEQRWVPSRIVSSSIYNGCYSSST